MSERVCVCKRERERESERERECVCVITYVGAGWRCWTDRCVCGLLGVCVAGSLKQFPENKCNQLQ